MKAVVLIGGFGTRLEPLTVTLPKAMVPVVNVPFLELLIKRLTSCGIDQIILSMGYLPEYILECLGDRKSSGERIEYVVEDKPLGTGGGIKNAQKYLDDTFLIVNGDIFTDIDIAEMLEFHKLKRAVATIALTPVDDPTQYGVIVTDEQGRVKQFLEKPARKEAVTNLINAGLIIMEPFLLDYIPDNTKFSYERELFPLLIKEGKPVYGFASDAYWIDIGTPEKYFQLNSDLLGGLSVQYNPVSDIPVHTDQSACLEKCVQLQDTVVIGPEVQVGKGARIKNSIIWNSVVIGDNALIENSVIASSCNIGENCKINGAVIGSDVVIASNLAISSGSRIYPLSEIR